jgi:hypothetical protein
MLLLAGSLGALPRPAAAQAKGKTELDKLVSAARLSPSSARSWRPSGSCGQMAGAWGLPDFTGHVILL